MSSNKSAGFGGIKLSFNKIMSAVQVKSFFARDMSCLLFPKRRY